MAKGKNRASEMIKLLNKRIFRSNKGRNLVAILAIIMTTLMFTTLLTLARSMSDNLIEMTFRQTGYDGQASVKQIEPEEAKLFAGHPEVTEVGESIVLGLAENDELAGRQVEIRWGDESYASHSFSMPTAGNMPQSDNEVALDTITLDRLGIPHEIGQNVMLEWRKDLNDPAEIPMQSQFTLCGYWEGNTSVYAGMAWVGRGFADKMTGGVYNDEGKILGQYMAQINLKSSKHIEETMDGILSDTGLKGLEYSVNLAYSPEMGATAMQETLPMYLGMILVFIAGYLIIYNIFQISVASDIQFYGKLKTLGMGGSQIKRLIFGQSNRLCLIGIPLGLIFGWILGSVLVPVFTGIIEGGGRASASPMIFIGSAIFAWLTVIISCMRPARLAGKVSPMEALRMNDSDSGSKRKIRKSKKGASIPAMAWANLGRNKKRTITVICSLTLGFVLLSSFYAKNAAFDMDKYLEGLTIADFTLEDASSNNIIGGYDPQGKTLNAALVESVEDADGVEAVGHQYSHQFVWNIDEASATNYENYYTQERLDDWASYDAAGAENFKNALKSREMNAEVFGLDGIPLESITKSQYILAGNYDAEAFAGGNYVLAIGIDQGGDYSEIPAPSVGSTVELEGKSYEVMAIVYPLSSVSDGAGEGGVSAAGPFSQFVVPTSVFKENWPDNTLRRLFVNVDDENLDGMREWLDDYVKTEDSSLPVVSRESMAAQYERETRSSAVMGNAISIVIAMVGILNFINSMVTAIISRKREFAMIQSVGMTKKQLRRMLTCEGLYYAGITLAASYIISALVVGIAIRAITASGFTTFHFTLLPLAICTPLLIAFAVLIPYICFKNLEKQSIVERLRTAN